MGAGELAGDLGVTEAEAISKGDDGRDPATGRFLPGWRGGPGNPRLRHLASLQEAARCAITAGDLQEVLRAMRDQARKGDAAAANVLLTRVLGRAREEPPQAPGIELGDLSSATGCASATAAIAAAAAAGAVEPDVAATLATLVGKAAELGALRDLETRIAELEKRP